LPCKTATGSGNRNGNQKRQPETAKRSGKKNEEGQGRGKNEVFINGMEIERPAVRAVRTKTRATGGTRGHGDTRRKNFAPRIPFDRLRTSLEEAEEMKVEKHFPKACPGPDPGIPA
jgi:hypothetical protein